MGEGEIHRFNVNFAPDTYDTLRRRSTARGVSMSQHLRDCIVLLKWFEAAHDRGERILLNPRGTDDVQEVVWL